MCRNKKPSLEISLQASSDEGSRFCDHVDRITQFGDLKKRSRDMGKYLLGCDAEKEHVLANKVLSCANYLQFYHFPSVDTVKLMKVHTCQKTMLCPFCARARAAKMVLKYKERLDIVLKENPNLIPAFLTQTVKNGSDLAERFKHLKKANTKLINKRRVFKKTGRGYTELSKISGGVYAYEISYNNDSKEWHPHIHSIVLLDKYIDQKALSAEWLKITGDSWGVDIRKVTNKPGETMIDSLLEIFKYSVKFSEMDFEQNYHIHKVLQGIRLQSAYGNMWGVKIPEKEEIDPLSGLSYYELYYKYSAQNGAYDLSDMSELKHNYISSIESKKSNSSFKENKKKMVKKIADDFNAKKQRYEEKANFHKVSKKHVSSIGQYSISYDRNTKDFKLIKPFRDNFDSFVVEKVSKSYSEIEKFAFHELEKNNAVCFL